MDDFEDIFDDFDMDNLDGMFESNMSEMTGAFISGKHKEAEMLKNINDLIGCDNIKNKGKDTNKGKDKGKKWEGPTESKKCKQPTSWLQKSFKCDKFNQRCNNNDSIMIIPQCACQLVWARGSKDASNKFCQRLTDTEKDNLVSLATSAMRNDLDILPQNRFARKMMIKSLYKG